MRPAHTITLQPWRGLSFGERMALEGATAMLWPLKADDRMTVLINLLSAQIEAMVESEDQIDAIVDVLRLQLKLKHGEVTHETAQQAHRAPGDA
jgi:hypothetical protein